MNEKGGLFKAPFSFILSAAMSRISVIIFVLLSIFPGLSFAVGTDDLKAGLEVLEKDYRAFYLDGHVMGSLGAGIAGAGLLANSSADREIHEYFQNNLRSGATDAFSDASRIPSDVLVAVPLLFGTYALLDDGPVKTWAGDSLRALFVGAPAGLFIQYATGASRPEEGGSGWKPFNGNNGLSGHAFVGAVPFITAAKMQDNTAMKTLFYGLSVLPGLSRMNDEKHYVSQVALGWWLAYLSASVIHDEGHGTSVRLSPFPEGVGITLSAVF